MNIGRIMASQGCKVISGEIMLDIDPYTEWIKWLSYIPDFQKEVIEKIVNDFIKTIDFTHQKMLENN